MGENATFWEKTVKNEKSLKVWEKSMNFNSGQGNSKFWKKSGKSQGVSCQRLVIFFNVNNYCSK